MAEGSSEIKRLIIASADLKRELVAFAQSARFDRYREAELRKAAGEGGDPPAPGGDRWVQAMDDFIMTFRFPDGTGVIDRFLASGGTGGKPLRKSDRRLLEGWRDPVDGVFELRSETGGQIALFNLIDELTYRAYAPVGVARVAADEGDFVLARLVPLEPGAWLVSGNMTPFPREHAKVVAELALDWLRAHPALAFRNPEKLKRGWELMREDRDHFTEFFGGDQVVFSPSEALDRLNEYYRARQEEAVAEQYPDGDVPEGVDTGEPFFTLPPEQLGSMTTIGVIYDETDGMSLLPELGMLEELFSDPSLADTDSYRDALLSYLDSESIYPGPLRRLADAHPDTTDDVFRKVLKKPTFAWADQGEHLLRKHKSWYFKQDRYPKTTPASDYLLSLLGS